MIKLKQIITIALLIFGLCGIANSAVNIGPYYGVWNAKTTYPVGGLITENNQTYIALVKNKNKPVSTNTTIWTLLSNIVVGLNGLQGIQGIKGDTGLQGPQGIAGAQGIVGPQGLQGPTGTTGGQGIQGATGADGPIGPKGDTGATGAAGTQGPTGPQGVQGVAGVPQAGNNVGDIQYWDGTQWQVIPPPLYTPATTTKALAQVSATFKFCNTGIPTWKDNCDPIPGFGVYNIGDNGPAGGIVFYLNDETGLHGLEVSPVNQATYNPLISASGGVKWGCYNSWISGADGTIIGTGKTNTDDILAGCLEQNSAASIARSYTLNGFQDWFLPSKDELNLIYQQKNLISGLAKIQYWTSSQTGPTTAYDLDFNTGNLLGNNDKNGVYAVRAIRTF